VPKSGLAARHHTESVCSARVWRLHRASWAGGRVGYDS
jgi:hypothetical protein